MNLVTLLDLDLRSAALSFLGLAGERLRIAFCERCSYEGIVYTAVDLLGGSRWSGHSRPPKFIHPSDPYQPWPRRPLVLGQRRRTPIEANLLERYGLVGVSQMGGYPSWIQDAEHPMCPECQRPMSFVGQVAWGDIAVAEGITYAFVCVDCGMAATNYQQT